MQRTTLLLAAGALAISFAGCSASGASPAAPTRVCNIGANVLQLNVGTANLFGDVPASAVLGTNVAVTYRQSSSANCFVGTSGTQVNSPTLTLPGALAGPANLKPDGFLSTIVGGPDPTEVGHTSMTSTSQVPNAANSTTFGVSGGAFGLGLEPFNISSVNGTPDSAAPYPVPLYDPIVGGGGVDPNAFVPGGGPPAFNIAGNLAAGLRGFNGVSEGLDVFEVTPAVGTYSLSVLVPANTGSVTATASAAISTVVPLPSFVAPVPVLAGTTGGATIAVALPAGVTEAYIQVTDFGSTTITAAGPPAMQATSCSGATLGKPLYYTIVVKASGTATLPAGSLCTPAQNATSNGGVATDGDAFTVQGIGFDYGAYEASYPNSLGVTSPSLAGAGASHQADVTVSSQGVYNQPAAGPALVNGAGGAALPASALRARGSGR